MGQFLPLNPFISVNGYLEENNHTYAKVIYERNNFELIIIALVLFFFKV